MKTIIAISALLFCAIAWSDGQAPVTFSGKGKSSIEVRDSSGKVEVINPSQLRLNQIPSDAVAREEAYRAKQKELTQQSIATEQEQTAEAKKTADAKAADDAKAKAEAAAAADAATKLEEEQYPRKVRRNTVRGTRFIENPVVEPEKPEEPEGPVLSMTGKKKTPPKDQAAAEKSDKPAESTGGTPVVPSSVVPPFKESTPPDGSSTP